MILLSNESAIVLNSHISTKDNKIKSMIPIKIHRMIGKSDIITLCKEYLYLSRLNWNDPILLSKNPLVLNIANKMASMIKDLRTSEPLKFFPL